MLFVHILLVAPIAHHIMHGILPKLKILYLVPYNMHSFNFNINIQDKKQQPAMHEQGEVVMSDDIHAIYFQTD